MHSHDDEAAADAAGPTRQQVVYVSQAVPGAGSSPRALAQILKTARRKNQAAGITGLLVTFDGRFLQYLEGPAPAVHDILATIRLDARHCDMEILLDAPTDDARLFRHWAMARLVVGSAGWHRLVAADWPRIRPLAPDSPPGLQVLRELAQHPEDTVDRDRVFGASDPGRRETDIVVADPPPELLAARLNFAAAVVIALALALTLLYRWLG